MSDYEFIEELSRLRTQREILIRILESDNYNTISKETIYQILCIDRKEKDDDI